MLAMPFQQAIQAFMRADALPRTMRALEHHGGVVLLRDRLGQATLHRGLGPRTEQIRIAGIVHDMHQARPRRTPADLAEDGFAFGRVEPLHVREAVANAQGLDHGTSQRAALGRPRRIQIFQAQRLRADPMVQLRDQRFGPVPTDVFEQHLAVRTHGVIGVLLALDVLFDDDLRHMLGRAQGVLQLGLVAHLIGVVRSGPRHGLQNQRKANAFRLRQNFLTRARPPVARHTHAGGFQHALHLDLVAQRRRLGHRRPRHAQALAQLGRQDHARLPQALDLVRPAPAEPVLDGGHGRLLIPQALDGQVPRQRPPRLLRQRLLGLIAHAPHTRAHLRQPAHKERHLGRIAGREEEDVHATHCAAQRVTGANARSS